MRISAAVRGRRSLAVLASAGVAVSVAVGAMAGVVVSCLLAASGVCAAGATDGMLTVEVTVGVGGAFVEGSTVGLDQPPVLLSGRTLVPFRFLGETLGATISWYPQSRQVVASYAGIIVVLRVGSTGATVNNKPVTLDAPPALVNGRVMVPLRFLAEAFGWEVAWDAATQTATVRRPSRDWDLELDLDSAALAFPIPSLGDTQWLGFRAVPGTLYAATFDGKDAWALMARLCDGARVPIAGAVNGFAHPESDFRSDDLSFIFRAGSEGPFYFQVWAALEGYCPRLPSSPYGLRVAAPTPLGIGQAFSVPRVQSGGPRHRWFCFEASRGQSYRVTTSLGTEDLAVYGPEPDFQLIGYGPIEAGYDSAEAGYDSAEAGHDFAGGGHCFAETGSAAAMVFKAATSGTYYVAFGASEAYTITVSQEP